MKEHPLENRKTDVDKETDFSLFFVPSESVTYTAVFIIKKVELFLCSYLFQKAFECREEEWQFSVFGVC